MPPQWRDGLEIAPRSSWATAAVWTGIEQNREGPPSRSSRTEILCEKGRCALLRSNFLHGSLAFGITLLLGPGLLASPQGCRAGAPASAGDVPQQASSLLQQIKERAAEVGYLTDQLSGLERDGALTGWEQDADLLMETRDQVNAMDAMLCRLQSIEPEALAWQRKAVDRIAPKIYEMDNYLTDSIKCVNNYQDNVHIFDQQYIQDTDDMFDRADYIVKSVGTFEEYASARHEIHQLRPELGLKTGS